MAKVSFSASFIKFIKKYSSTNISFCNLGKHFLITITIVTSTLLVNQLLQPWLFATGRQHEDLGRLCDLHSHTYHSRLLQHCHRSASFKTTSIESILQNYKILSQTLLFRCTSGPGGWHGTRILNFEHKEPRLQVNWLKITFWSLLKSGYRRISLVVTNFFLDNIDSCYAGW